jgi:hypothetical protein
LPPINELEKDIESVSDKNPRVDKLMIWRGNIVAHIGSKVSLGKNQILVKNSLWACLEKTDSKSGVI